MMLNQIQQALGAALTMVVTFVPKFIAFLAVLLIGWAVARLLERAFDAVLERVGFDRLVERGGLKKALARSRYDASGLLSRLVFYLVMLFVLQLSFAVWGPNPVSLMLTDVIAYLPRVFAAGIIVVVGAAVGAAVADLLRAGLGALSYGRALAAAASIAILVVTAFAALTQLEIAPAIVVGLFYAILAIIVGIAVVAIGGAGVQPLRAYWQRVLNRMDQEAPVLSDAAKQMPDAAKAQAQRRAQQVRETTGVGARSGSGVPPRGGSAPV